MRVCGIDPGRNTGVVIWDTEGSGVVAHDSISDKQCLVNWLESNVRHYCSVVVVEDFIGAGPRSADTVFTLKLLGFIEGWCEFHCGLEVETQPPQWRKPFLDESQQFFHTHKLRHMKDALAHVFAYLDRIGEFDDS